MIERCLLIQKCPAAGKSRACISAIDFYQDMCNVRGKDAQPEMPGGKASDS